MSTATTPAVPSETSASLRKFSAWERVKLWLITWAAFLILRLLGPTLRFGSSLEDGAPQSLAARPLISAFWHNCVLAATYTCRDMGVKVMTSASFDGEYIARIISKFGFVPVRGSSSRGAVRALLGMRREVEQGESVTFTIDGPRGPRYVAKPGPVLLARETGAPLVAFYIAVDKAWKLNTWDGFMIPKPFSRVLLRMSRKIMVSAEADKGEMERCHAELQAALERVQKFAEANVGKVGVEFPVVESARHS